MISDNDVIQNSEYQSEDYSVPAAITDTGCERDLNEDRYAVIESRSGIAWIVCDGMGGASGGELASQLAIDAIRRDLEGGETRLPDLAFESSLVEANRVITLRRQNQAFAGMGTTLVGALFSGNEVVVANVGDSRAYLIRNGQIKQLTEDHTLVQELVNRGELMPSQALSHPQAHILTRCIGAEPVLKMDLKKFWLWDSEYREFLLLCSDGLYSMIEDHELLDYSMKLPPQQACVELVELAKERGGYDNITLAIIPLPGTLKSEPSMQDLNNSHNAKYTNGMMKSGSTIGNLDPLRVGLFVAALTVLSAMLVVVVMALLIA